MPEHELPEPPPPPDVERRLRLHRHQWIGVPLLALLPILAVAGVFGESWRVEQRANEQLELTLRYPTRYRYKQLNSIELWIRNRSPATIDTVSVAVDTAFGNRFSTVRSIPGFDSPYELSLTRLEPGESRMVVIEIQGEHYGRHSGRLEVHAADTLGVTMTTFIFP
ncbi:MAG: hypothetical protein ACRELV_00585 [Longimicrobiales bacterium]